MRSRPNIPLRSHPELQFKGFLQIVNLSPRRLVWAASYGHEAKEAGSAARL